MGKDTKTAPQSRRLLVGNWKCTKNLTEAHSWFETFARGYRPAEGLRVVISPPLIWLAQLSKLLETLQLPGVHLAAQDVSPFPSGSYTGALAADMLRSVADYVITGHPERRRYFHESGLDVTNKVSEALDAGIKPIICIDTSYAMSQLTALHDMDTEELVIAYCPLDNSSYHEALYPEKVQEAARFINQILPGRPIIYGGAITPDNVQKYAGLPELGGILVGQASLDPERFLQIHARMNG